MKVRKHTLLLLACLVWTTAGFNILRIGLADYIPYLNVTNVMLSAVVFVLFQLLVFGRLVQKHTARITAYQELYQFFWLFFDKKSFLIMACMMTLGIALRSLHLASQHFIAVFYTGLGSALLQAGLLFGIQYLKAMRRSQS